MDSKSSRITRLPMSIEEIVKAAQEYDYNPSVPIRRWLRTASTLLQEAAIYQREGDDQQAYLLLYRHADLILSKVSKHPEAKQEQYRHALKEQSAFVKTNLAELEVLAPRLRKRYARFEEAQRLRKQQEQEARSPRHSNDYGATSKLKDLSIHGRRPSGDFEALHSRQRSLEGIANPELAVRLARSEIKRRDANRRLVRQAGVSPQEEQERRVGGLWGSWEEQLGQEDQQEDALDDLSKTIAATRRQMDHDRAAERSRYDDFETPASTTSRYHYPSIPSALQQPSQRGSFSGKSSEMQPPLPPKRGRSSQEYFPPSVPPKLPPLVTPSQQTPAVPAKIRRDSDTSQTPSRELSRTPPLQAPNYTFKPAAYLENGKSLRTLFLPPDLRARFLAVAYPNTNRQLETCGILCGTLISNALFVSKLVIPEQESTSDTCETTNEGALFDYCDKEDLMVLGWIHTHPTQTCFMSSRDLHTHGGYQVMMPESIAIVCAPSKEPSWGVFRLTDPPGMPAILNCTQTGLFHPHAETHIYTDAMRPGHVVEAKGLEFELVDLRP